ncbi:M56 family metallopeptidase [Actinomadura rudentiformis]|uniref:M56 family metallopeptidase n=1 Tax=Actinomadura rudentiformis TaxID=359158 RepID=A0A6H9YPN2_9ACTN|nr:M56 family metallopeptidase [Actinomadura rudentiformis]KAB2346936.1 M56 family metallopeptidase [Actinomadura rudentiformis]
MSVLLIGLIAATILLGYLAGPVLVRLRPLADHPGALVACWAGLLLGTVTATAALTSMALLVPPTPGHGLLEWLHDCLPHHSPVAFTLGGLTSLALLGACGARLAQGLPRLWRAVRRRREHRSMLHLVAREDRRNADVLLLDHPLPVAYCLPSRWRPIVVSTGAQTRLTGLQLQAVLAHERAHLRQRHHALLLFLDLAHTLLPWLPTVRLAKATLPVLLEMSADDAAARRWGRHTLAGALRQVASTPGLAGALAAAGTGEGLLSRRLTRLEAPTSAVTPHRARRAAAWIVAAGTAAIPVITAAATLTSLAGVC